MAVFGTEFSPRNKMTDILLKYKKSPGKRQRFKESFKDFCLDAIDFVSAGQGKGESRHVKVELQ